MTALVALSYFAGLSPVLLPIIEYGIDFHRIATEECENIDQRTHLPLVD